ncbi:MAG: hypothetical protein J0L57_00765 [Burkholderiales bacterium]|nr:hypothetical protein [Burkholderiales bacterium]
MGKWAAALAAHLADRPAMADGNPRHPTVGSPAKPSEATSEGFDGGSERACCNLAAPVNGAANDGPHARTRPYRLTKAEADAAHAEPWGDVAIGRFVARVTLFLRRGLNATDADDLAEALHLRDVQGADHVMCLECRHVAGRPGARRCGNHVAAAVGRDLPEVLAIQLQRCPGFGSAAS